MSLTVLEAARQGDAQAIAHLLHQAFEPKGVKVQAIREADCLHVLLQAEPVPDRQLVAIVQAGVARLNPDSIHTIQIYGRKAGQSLPTWTKKITLTPPSRARAHPVFPTPSSPPLPPDPLPPDPQPPTPVRGVSPQENSRLPTPHSPLPTPPTHRRRFTTPIAFLAGLILGMNWHLLANSFTQLWSADSVAGSSQNGIGSPPEQTIALTPSSSASDPASVESEGTEAGVEPISDATSPAIPVSEPAQTVSEVAPIAETTITIKSVGDIIPGTNYPSDRLPDQDGNWLFDGVKDFFGETDILFGNFESTLTDYAYTPKDTSRGQTFAFRTPPHYADLLKSVGFDVLSVANNHSFDFDDQGFEDTIAHIEKAGMQAVGRRGQIVYRTVNDVTVAFIGFSYFSDHNSVHELDLARALVDEAKQQASIVVISVHAGAEGSDAIRTRNETEFFFGENRGNMVEFSRAVIDQGADLVLGDGPHVPRAIELYKSRLIAYSLGNFMGYRTLSTDGVLGDSLILETELAADGRFISGKIIPVRLDNRGVPFVDDNFRSVSLIRNLIESDFPVTPLLIGNDGEIMINEAE
ncbi:CapA family protein [Egbenema bharatensis]|uniref:CapA family protein n=1 Tax=Egbenema bharatensis TaxID=3463334 RepID=UPI003A8A06ED